MPRDKAQTFTQSNIENNGMDNFYGGRGFGGQGDRDTFGDAYPKSKENGANTAQDMQNNNYRKVFRPDGNMKDIERKEKLLINNIGMLNDNLDIQKEILGSHVGNVPPNKNSFGAKAGPPGQKNQGQAPNRGGYYAAQAQDNKRPMGNNDPNQGRGIGGGNKMNNQRGGGGYDQYLDGYNPSNPQGGDMGPPGGRGQSDNRRAPPMNKNSGSFQGDMNSNNNYGRNDNGGMGGGFNQGNNMHGYGGKNYDNNGGAGMGQDPGARGNGGRPEYVRNQVNQGRQQQPPGNGNGNGNQRNQEGNWANSNNDAGRGVGNSNSGKMGVAKTRSDMGNRKREEGWVNVLDDEPPANNNGPDRGFDMGGNNFGGPPKRNQTLEMMHQKPGPPPQRGRVNEQPNNQFGGNNPRQQTQPVRQGQPPAQDPRNPRQNNNYNNNNKQDDFGGNDMYSDPNNYKGPGFNSNNNNNNNNNPPPQNRPPGNFNNNPQNSQASRRPQQKVSNTPNHQTMYDAPNGPDDGEERAIHDDLNDVIKNQAQDTENEQVYPCTEGCGRSFKQDTLEKHARICKKVFQSKRKKFDVSKQRVDAEQIKAINEHGGGGGGKFGAAKGKVKPSEKPINTKHSNKPNWKKQSEAFRAAMKGSQPTEGMSAMELKAHKDAMEELGPKLDACPHCNRKFGDEQLARHMGPCKVRIDQARMRAPPVGKKGGPPVKKRW